MSNARTRLPAYGRTPKELLRDPKIRALGKWIYAVIDEVAGHEDITMQRLSDWSGMDVKTVRKALHEMRDAGWIEVVERFRGNKQVASEYIANAYPYQTEEGIPSTGGSDSPPLQAPDLQERSEEVGIPSNRGGELPEPEPPVAVGVPKIGRARGTKKWEGEDETTRRTTTPPSPSGFDAWWDVWPKKQGKGTARTAYARALKKIPEEELLSKTRSWVAAKPYSDMKFCPMPSTWLNGERWDDDVVPARTGSAGSAGSWVLGLTPEQMALAAAVGQ